MSKITWRIYYTDGTTFDNEDGPASAAPAIGVQVIAQADDTVGRVLVQGGDYYWMHQGQWFGGDVAGVYAYLLSTGRLLPGARFRHAFDLLEWMTGTGLVKLGEMLRPAAFVQIYHRAYDDPDLPPKSAFHPRERRGEPPCSPKGV
jgi:hypothetical protein